MGARSLQFDRLFIGGQWVEPASSDKIGVLSQITEELTASVPAGGVTDMDRAVEAARHAFEKGGWETSSVGERVAVLTEFRDRLVAAAGEMAALITDEMGCPITQSRNNQVANPIGVLDTYLELAPDFPFREVRVSVNGAAGLITREPVGVVAAVIPWNMPLLTAMHKIAPAVLAGCTVVLKPSPEAPLSSYLLAELLADAGLPPGVLNVVPADREASEYLVGHPGVDKVAFTGSSAAGRRIGGICGQDLRRVTLELGGKSAAIILDDADLDATAESLRMGSFRNSGQVCSLKTRVLVSQRRAPELLERLVTLVRSMPVGDPRDTATQIGPLVSARQRGVVEGYLEIARAEGARVIIGGGRPKRFDRGWWVEPTILADVKPGMRVAQEEIFGPVLSVITYRDEDDAITIANNSAYGLNGSVFAADVHHAMDVARRIRTGTVEINGSPAGFAAPVGGVKGSGIGREGSREGLEHYTEPKALGLPPALAAELD
jgi:aldehyde dehydrogenase (NAD+)